MTIREVTMYQALCDRCGNADDEGDYFAWADAEQAVDQALESEWEQIGDRLLCPSCVVWSDAEDQFVERSDEPRSAGQPVRRAAADKPPISAVATWTNEQEETVMSASPPQGFKVCPVCRGAGEKWGTDGCWWCLDAGHVPEGRPD